MEAAVSYCDRVSALDREFAGKVQEAVDKFYAENTVEEGEGRFLCPLSGKRFKGAEFVRKHIDNKHADALTAVKEKALSDKFLQLFLLDPHKPPQAHRTVLRGAFAQQALQAALLASGSRRRPERASYGGEQRGYGGGGGGGYDRSYDRGYERGGSDYGDRYDREAGGGGSAPMPFVGDRRDPRPLRQYVDLDAPGLDDLATRGGVAERKAVVYD